MTLFIHLQEEFQKEANRFAKLQEENSNGILPAVKNTTYLDRYRENRKKMGIFKSFFKATFGKKRMEQEMAMKSNKGIIGDISETKKKSLEYL